MNTRRVNAAAGVILAAMRTKGTAAGIAASLEYSGLLQNPESARELVLLRARVEELEGQVADASEPDVDGAGRTFEEYHPQRAASVEKLRGLLAGQREATHTGSLRGESAVSRYLKGGRADV